MGKFVGKIRNFDWFGDVFPQFCPDKREIWHGEQCQLSRLSVQCVALAGRKPIFGLLSKCYTGMAALRERKVCW